MGSEKTLHFYLPETMLAGAKSGAQPIVKRIRQAVDPAGFRVEFWQDSPDNIKAARSRDGYAMYHLHEPDFDRALCFRKAYEYPMWAVEWTQARWNWAVAKAAFDPHVVDGPDAFVFTRMWRTRLFPNTRPRRGGYIYVPLQGKLTQVRSFQSMSPVAMLKQVLAHANDRPIIATLHPNEEYALAERAALEALLPKYPNLRVQFGGMQQLLPDADFVVTQNSSVAFAGFLLHKPAVLFGRSDFHHICLDAARIGAARALAEADTHRPDYDRYVTWYWKHMSFNVRRDGIETRIRDKLRSFDWPV